MRSVLIAIFVLCMSAVSSVVLAVDDEFARGQTTVTAGSNTITVDNNVKYVNYLLGDTIPVTLNYSGTCNLAYSGLALRIPKSFTPPKGVTGAISNASGTPDVGTPTTTGSATFDIRFDTLKKAGHSKQFGVAHLNLILGVDEDCAIDGVVDGTVTVGVQISVSTAVHP